MGANVFLSYGYETESELSHDIASHLRRVGCSVFRGQDSLQIGDDWVDSIDRALAQADYLVLLLSRHSATSEFVLEEVERARELHAKLGRPRILPVFIEVTLGELSANLRAALRSLHHWQWDQNQNLPALLRDIERAMATGQARGKGTPPPISSAQAPKPRISAVEPPHGQVPLDSPYYVERLDVDRPALAYVQGGHAMLRIRGSRQVGKSSLLSRISSQLRRDGAATMVLNLRSADRAALSSFEKFAEWFCLETSRKLKLAAGAWGPPRHGVKVASEEYFDGHVLPQLEGPLSIGIDEGDLLLLSSPDVAAEFYSMLRAWWDRGIDDETWHRLSFIFAHSTEPYSLLPIATFRSPFDNVIGMTVSLLDFSEPEVDTLFEASGSSLSPSQRREFLDWFGGHPYLIRRALHELQKALPFAKLLARAPSESGPFGDHLKSLWWHLRKNELSCAAAAPAKTPTLLGLAHELIDCGPMSTRASEMEQLEALGVALEREGLFRLRCGLYREYLLNKRAVPAVVHASP